MSFGVLSHVTMLNFSDDIPVKLFSSHPLALALSLIAPDLRRLTQMFLFNRGVDPVEFRSLLRRVWLNCGAILRRTPLVLVFVVLALQGADWSHGTFGDLAPQLPLCVIGNVDDLLISRDFHWTNEYPFNR